MKWVLGLLLLMSGSEVFAANACTELLFKSQPTLEEYGRMAEEEHGKFDRLPNFRQGVRKLRDVNVELEHRKFTVQELVTEGYISIGKSRIEPDIPYIQIRLNKIDTVILVPEAGPSDIHKNPMMFVPGAGTPRSNGRSVTGPAYTFMKTKKSYRPALGDALVNQQYVLGYRGYAYIFDPPGNFGFSRRAPGFLSSADGMQIAMRHAHLIMDNYLRSKYKYERPLIVAGRSMGGLQVAEYAHRFGYEDNLLAAIAVSPQPNQLINVINTMERHRPDGIATQQLRLNGREIELDHPTLYTAAVQSTNYRLVGKAKVPILFMQSLLDPSYEKSLQTLWLNSLHKQDPTNHIIHYLPSELRAGHDLWDKPMSDSEIRRLTNRKRDADGEEAAERFLEEQKSEQQFKAAIFDHTLYRIVNFINEATFRYESFVRGGTLSR
ncbi:MAG: hypothetical protein R2827_02395 [Bdellovibrionales bacterium]